MHEDYCTCCIKKLQERDSWYYHQINFEHRERICKLPERRNGFLSGLAVLQLPLIKYFGELAS
jgi:hypothetical protein